MVEQTLAPPLIRGRWYEMSWDEFLDWAPDEGQAEWVEGWGIAYVSNSTLHADFVAFLADLLRRFLVLSGGGRVFSESVLLHLPMRPAGRMPDILVVLPGNEWRVHDRGVEGSADLIVEFLSESSATTDATEKRAEYETAGVREYLRIDARLKQPGFTFERLIDGRYHPVVPDAAGRYHSAVLAGFWLDPTWFRHGGLPDIDDLLLQIVPDAYERWILGKIRTRRASS